jgi:hypothetical protein
VLPIEHWQQACEPLLDGPGFEQLLAFREVQVEIHRHEVGEAAGFFGIKSGDFDLLGKRGGKLDDFLELVLGVAHHGRQFHAVFGNILEHLEAGTEVGFFAGVVLDLDAPQTLNEHSHGVVGEFEHLQQAGGTTDFVHLLRAWVLSFGIALKNGSEQAVAGDDVVDELDALGGFDEERGDHSGKDDDIREA